MEVCTVSGRKEGGQKREEVCAGADASVQCRISGHSLDRIRPLKTRIRCLKVIEIPLNKKLVYTNNL